MEYGFVYVMKNNSMPNLFKIGHTLKSPKQRAVELSRHTNMPDNFEVIYYGEIENPKKFEHELHDLYKELRVNSSREFFNLSDDDVFWLCNYIQEICDNVSKSEHFNMLELKIIHGE